MIEPLTASYIAGLIDSDGCIQIMKRKSQSKDQYSLRLSLSQVTDIVPNWLLSKVGGRIDIVKTYNRDIKNTFRWSIDSVKAKDILQACLPFLVLKQERAMVGIGFQETVGFRGFADRITNSVADNRLSLYLKMRELNKSSSRFNYKKEEVN